MKISGVHDGLARWDQWLVGTMMLMIVDTNNLVGTMMSMIVVWSWLVGTCAVMIVNTMESMIGWHVDWPCSMMVDTVGSMMFGTLWVGNTMIDQWWLVDCYIIVNCDGWYRDNMISRAQPRQVDNHNDRHGVSSAKRSYSWASATAGRPSTVYYLCCARNYCHDEADLKWSLFLDLRCTNCHWRHFRL